MEIELKLKFKHPAGNRIEEVFMQEIEEFLRNKNIFAVVGVSRNPRKYGYKIYKDLKKAGYTLYPVNPNADKILGEKCYHSLGDLPKKPDVVITIVSPRVTEQIVKECKNLKINRVWMQPGSESEKAIKFCKTNNIKTVYNVCFVVDGLKKKLGD